MRTVRIKLYPFNELSVEAQKAAIGIEAKRFDDSVRSNERFKGFFNDHELDAAKDRLIKQKAEFTVKGERIYLSSLL